MTKLDPSHARIIPLLNNEDAGQLEKVARIYDSQGRVAEEYKIFPDSNVGDACLRRNFNYSGANVIGQEVLVDTWTQALEDLANPQPSPITDIVLSNQTVNDGDPAGTVVAIIYATGGQDPITFTETADPDDKFEIVGNELRLTAPADILDSSYFVGIQAQDAAAQTFTKGFTITVDPAAAFVNQKSLKFDSPTLSRVNVGQPANLDFDPSTDDFSISLWIKAPADGGTRNLVSKRNNTNGTTQFQLYLDSGGTLLCRVGSGTATNSGIVLKDDNWHHVVLANDASLNNHSLFIDGVFAASGLSGSSTNAYDILLGSRRVSGNTGSTENYNGYMDEVAFFDKTLSGVEVNEIYDGGTPNDLLTITAGSNLITWYRMGDGDFLPNIIDNATGGNDAVVEAGNISVENEVPSAAAAYSNTLSTFFNGINQSCIMGTPTDSNYDNTDTFSISFWVKRDVISGNNTILGNSNGLNNIGYLCYFDGNAANRLSFNFNNSGAQQIRARWDLGAGITATWVHVAITYDGSSDISGLNCYLDGVLQSRINLENTLASTTVATTPITFGSLSEGGNFFEGNIDEIAFYDIELNASQVSDIYNSGTLTDLSTLSTNANLTHWYRMGDGDTYPIIHDQAGSFDVVMLNMSGSNFEVDVP